MNWFVRLAQEFQDSPNYVRDRANLVSGVTIGVTALLLNFAVMLAVGPFIFAPDDPEFMMVTESVGLGQLLALLLLGGATILATFLIPIRLVTVFWGPRIGRYFDQIVLSGISPMRFIIGKATSQNLFLALILFLLLPYFVLSLSLGGVHFGFFFAGVTLLWLYCMGLALVTIWLCLYFNELIAGMLVIAGAGLLLALGCVPSKVQPFVLTPAPALLQTVYGEMPSLQGKVSEHFVPVFLASVAAMSVLCLIALVGIYLGPLYGIIRENSTFGEVVRKGDNKKKRWFRFRYHIQRPSEIAFLYENRDNVFRHWEGLIRWGVGFAALLLASLTSASFFPLWFWRNTSGGVIGVHMPLLLTHAGGILIACLLFSHAKNSTMARLPYFSGWFARVGRLDSLCFMVFVMVSNVAILAIAWAIETYDAAPMNRTIFSSHQYGNSGRIIDFVPLLFEGSVIISVAGLVVYAMHRYICTFTWLKSVPFVIVVIGYIGVVCLLPFFFVGLYIEMRWLPLSDTFPFLAQLSPFINIIFLCEEFPRDFDKVTVTRIPFYITHALLLIPCVWGIRRRESKLADQYLAPEVPAQDPASSTAAPLEAEVTI